MHADRFEDHDLIPVLPQRDAETRRPRPKPLRDHLATAANMGLRLSLVHIQGYNHRASSPQGDAPATSYGLTESEVQPAWPQASNRFRQSAGGGVHLDRTVHAMKRGATRRLAAYGRP